MENEEKVFMYRTRKEYEVKLSLLVKEDLGDTPEYESIVEEYLQFCTTE